MRRRWMVAVGVTAAGGVALLLWLSLVLLPSRWVRSGDIAGSNAQNDVRTTLVQALGGGVLAIGAFFTARQLQTTRQGQITERYTRAVDQLGHAEIDVRIGGIYALERIARDSAADRPTIGEVLTWFVRGRSPWPPSRPGQFRETASLEMVALLQVRGADVQAALTVLARDGFTRALTVDLSQVDLRRTRLSDAHLEGAILTEAHLEGSNLERANLEGALLMKSYLDRARLCRAQLVGADLTNAHLEGVDLTSAVVVGAKLHDANLEGADLTYANLEGADLSLANLSEATLWTARLKFAGLAKADLRKADLNEANLEWANLSRSNLEGARLRKAKLSGADLTMAHLEGADFMLAGLDGAYLRGANLRGANLEQADLSGANLERANLERANLVEVSHDETTLWPEGFALADNNPSPGVRPARTTQDDDQTGPSSGARPG